MGGSLAGLLVLILTWIIARRWGRKETLNVLPTSITSPNEMPSSMHKLRDAQPSTTVFELPTHLSIYELPNSNELSELPTPANCIVRSVEAVWI